MVVWEIGMGREMVIDFVSLQKGAEDFRHLLGRGYPRKNSLELIGNRYSLTKEQRDLLHRGVFAPEDAARRREKILSIQALEGVALAVDGYNVLITVEAALCRRPLIVADDGLIRDISGISSGYTVTSITDKAIALILDRLISSHPKRVDFLFDSPISKSGHLASGVTDRLRASRLAGEAQAVRVPETILMGYPGLVATSDSAIIDGVKAVVDLAAHVIRDRVPEAELITL